MRNIKRKYKGFSLVEMLLTLMILSVVMLMVASTLNTVIKVSNTTNSKNKARSDMSYIMEYMKRVLTNTELSDIYVFNSLSNRYIAGDDNGGIKVGVRNSELDATFYDSTTSKVDNIQADDEKLNINEVHVKLYGYSEWTCIGFFEDEKNEFGYLVRAVYDNVDSEGEFKHQDCFTVSDATIIPLHSFMINVKDFNISYTKFSDDTNSLFIVNATLEPLYWPVRDTFPVTRQVSRQSVISTQALTWY